MRILTGDECGLLKECLPELSFLKDREADNEKDRSFPSKTPSITVEGVQRIDQHQELQSSRSRGVVDMCYTPVPLDDDSEQDQSSSSFAVLRVNGEVELWERQRNSGVVDEPDGKPPSFGRYHSVRRLTDIFGQNDPARARPMSLANIRGDRLCASSTTGDISVLDSSSVVTTFSAFPKSKATTLTTMKGSYENRQLATAMAVNSHLNSVAVSGRERETTLLDLSTGKSVWKAKNLPPDPQTLLQHPIWTTALLFLNDTSAVSSQSANILVAGTAYRQVRLYDVRVASNSNASMLTSRRPFAYTRDDKTVFQHRITALCQADPNTLVVGDTTGTLVSFDLRMLKNRNAKLANVSRFVGPTGSIRMIRRHPTLPLIAAVGLDRMLRVYNTKIHKQKYCIYLKQRLNSVLFDNDLEWSRSVTVRHTGGVDDELDIEDRVVDYRDDESDDGSLDEASSSDSDEQVESESSTSEGDDCYNGMEDDFRKEGGSYEEDEVAMKKPKRRRLELLRNRSLPG